jgi:peptide/nickel transport system permease protein
MVYAMPGDYVKNITTGSKNVTPEMVENLKRLYGLDKGPVEGYVQWALNAVRGNFGMSFYYQRPVAEVMGEKMMVSFTLMLPVFIIELLIGIPFGIFSATKPYSKMDYIVTTFAFVGISVPTFFLATVLKSVFGYGLKWLPPSYIVDTNQTGLALFANRASNYVLPAAVLIITGVGAWMRYARTNMLDVMNADYVRTARAKGVPERAVVYRHAFSNTLIPLVTLIGGSIPSLFAGALVTENLFKFPGVGWAGYHALDVGDVPFIMGFNIVLASLTLLGTLISDITYVLVDPRVRLGGVK